MQARIFVFFFLLVAAAAAQFDNSPRSGGRVRVHLNFTTGTSCEDSASVTIAAALNGPIAEGFVDRYCVATFENIPSGRYVVSVSGRTLPTTGSVMG